MKKNAFFSMDTAHPIDDSEQHESFETNYLDPNKINFKHDGQNLSFTDSDGSYYPRVSLRRSFPLSADNDFIIVRVEEGEVDNFHELGVILDISDLNIDSLDAVNFELRTFYLVPVIKQIHSIREEFGFLYWSIDTDRGPKKFIMRDSIIGHVRQVGPGRWLIIDINQTRYEIHAFEQLDEQSQSYLSRYLLL